MLSLVIAILAALGIRFLVVEPFRIPTGSMAPTLYGEHAGGNCPACGFPGVRNYPGGGEGDVAPRTTLAIRCENCEERWPPAPGDWFQPRSGDRVLVLLPLVSWGLKDPERWSVVVFRAPIVSTPRKNFIKRLVGLPGERIRIHRGDLWKADPAAPGGWAILRKPPGVQANFWTHVHDTAYRRRDLRSPWAIAGEGAVRDDEGGFELRAKRGAAAIEFKREIRNALAYNDPDKRLYPVGDARVELEAEGEAGSSLRIELRGAGRTDPRIVRFGGTDSGAATASAGRKISIVLQRADGQVRLDVGGRTETADVEPGDPLGAVPVAIAAQQGHVRIHRIRIFRDIQYLPRSSPEEGSPETRALPEDAFFDIPPGRFMFFGDNSAASYDSREWPDPFVPRSDLLGTAFLVFWPPHRWGAVR